MTQEAIWITESDVSKLVPLDDAIDALENSLGEIANDTAFNVPKAIGDIGDGGSMHALGSASLREGVCGFKTWVHTAAGAKAVFSLFSTENGRLLAMLEANTLGQIRTSAMTAVGTRWMADRHASDMAIIGSGRQALAQIFAVNAVRPLKRLRIWSPTAEKRHAFFEKVATSLGSVQVVEATSLEDAVDGAEIVTLVTRATQPFFNARLLAPNAHLNAVGAILPHNAEFFPDVFERAGAIVVDNLVNTQKASREFIDFFGSANEGWAHVQTLPDVIRHGLDKKRDGDITLFKAMGMGISDLAVAKLAYERAVTGHGAEIRLPLSGPAPIRWSRN
ncbi:ornithine cyclodeaminase family protein [Caballeronia sp. LZ034LL]|uniref:ornithine cyclodeaminase family protein n=1 Tax=Caballeronia sp. LZ034LL TaxID=3038567 RepID=UPI00285CBC57|nr:ornithine cyclodeaminase family protein [Caballeronia sp. LZ034LL]MDR5835649.1 ornithine cyclodeaminase family protein [Caballeronia sp. LZ034LL]